MAGRALAGGFGPRLDWVSPWRCGKGDGLCHWGGAAAKSLTFRRAGRAKETHRVSPPLWDAATRAGAIRETRGQRRPRRVRKRPPLAGRALAGGFGPRLGWV
jgi:hypothetical protein